MATTNNHEPFSKNPLAPLFFEYIGILKSHNFHKEAEDLIAISEQYYLPENRNIIITQVLTKYPLYQNWCT